MTAHYGVREQTVSVTAIDTAVEMIRLRGFAVVDGGYSPSELEEFSTAFDRARQSMIDRYGREALEEVGEHDTLRLPPLRASVSATRDKQSVLEICRRLMGEYIVLNQQNGVVNGAGAHYSHARYHRDLPYQHFVSSRPLAVAALYCVDSFTAESGATLVIHGSHKEDAFPSDGVVESLQVQVTAPAGNFILMDAMLFHAGAPNRTAHDRRGVNHVFSIPLIRPQIDLITALGDDFTADPELRRLLGFDVATPRDIKSFYDARRRRILETS